MCRHDLPIAFPGGKLPSVRDVFAAFSGRQTIRVNLVGFTYEPVPDTNRLNLVPTAERSVVEAELIPLRPSVPRQTYRNATGVTVGLAPAGTYIPGQDPSHYGAGFWLRLTEGDWVLEYVLDTATCPVHSSSAINSSAAA